MPLHPLRGGSAALQQEPLNGCGFPPDQPAAEGSAASCRQQLHSALLLTMALPRPAGPRRPRGCAGSRRRRAAWRRLSKMAAGEGRAGAEGAAAAGRPRAWSRGGAASGLPARRCRWRPGCSSVPGKGKHWALVLLLAGSDGC